MNFRGTRKGIGPIAQPPMQHGAPQRTAQQMNEDRQRQRAIQESYNRATSKPTDRHIPEELAEVVVGDGVKRYAQLRDAERRLDALMMRKRLDIKENSSRSYSRQEGTLRLWISNTAEAQPWQVMEEGSGLNADGTFDFGDDTNSATWKMKIEGRLSPQDGDEVGQSKTQPKFSTFFKSITVDFNRNAALQPDSFSQITWHKQPLQQVPKPDLTSKENNFDSLEFERKGDENINVTINLVRDEAHERYRLKPALAELLNTDEDNMTGIVQGVWEYARVMNLQEDEDKRTITCDETLTRLFGQPKVVFPYLQQHIMPLVQQLPPIKLQYTIRVDKAYISPSDASVTPSQPTIYDIRVPLPNSIVPVFTAYKMNNLHLTTLKDLTSMDEDLALLVQKINNTNAKRKFYDNLSKDPAGFVQRWVGSQRRDLEVILAEAVRGGGEDGEQWRKGGQDGVWGSEVARESVGLWLARNQK